MELHGERIIVYWQKSCFCLQIWFLWYQQSDWCNQSWKHIDLRQFPSCGAKTSTYQNRSIDRETAILLLKVAIPFTIWLLCIHMVYFLLSIVAQAPCFCLHFWSSISSLCVSKWQYLGKLWLHFNNLQFFWNTWFFFYQKHPFTLLTVGNNQILMFMCPCSDIGSGILVPTDINMLVGKWILNVRIFDSYGALTSIKCS